MTRVRARGEDVRRFILDHVEKHPNDIAKVTAEHFHVTRQAVNKHLQRLTGEKSLSETGKTRSRTYKLAPIEEWRHAYELTKDLAEDIVWTEDIAPVLGKMPDNAVGIWHYGFTEMFNNALDHSGGSMIYVHIKKTAVSTQIVVYDNGVGIFKKIKAAFGLLDERHALLELHKGKLTTDPNKHTGEGIFFSSRAFDDFDIVSCGVQFTHKFGDSEDWIIERDDFEKENRGQGTAVWMKLHNHTSRTMTKVYGQFTSANEYGFNKTVVPVRLARYGNENLISRSQAKRLLARVELFKTVLFDFSEVQSIGQAFADEIFRVFAQQHPNLELVAIKANSEIKRMIQRAKAGGQDVEQKSLDLFPPNGG